VRSAASAALDKSGLGKVLVGLRDRHVVDAKLRSQTPHWRQTRTGDQFAGCDAIDNLLVQLKEEWPAIAFR
jgi:hypothetical protein